jgi:hypothetical protein
VVVAGVIVTAAGVFSGCGSHKATASCPEVSEPPTTPVPEAIPTAKGEPRSLVAERFPARLVGSLSFTTDLIHDDPVKPYGSRESYSIALNKVSLKLTSVTGSGVAQRATYEVAGGQAAFHGYEVSTTKGSDTYRISWRGNPGHPITGLLAIEGRRIGSHVSYDLRVPQRGSKTKGACSPKDLNKATTVTRTAKIPGGAFLILRRPPSRQRFSVGIEVEGSTGGPLDKGGYAISGEFRPPPGSAPVICMRTRTGLKCPAR